MKKNNKNIKIIQTRKYKNINLYLRFSISYTKQRQAALIVLSKLLLESCKKYPNKQAMTKAKDMLYGINMDAAVKDRANILSLNIQYSFINPKFLNDITIEDNLVFINETLNNALINNSKLKEAKTTLIAGVKRHLERPQAYAIEKAKTIVAKDNPQYLPACKANNLISEIKKVELNDVLNIYKYVLKKANLHVYLVGDLDNKAIKLLTNFDYSKCKTVKFDVKKLKGKTKKDIIERKPYDQSYLSVVYKTPFTKKHKDFFAFTLGNIFLGVVPTSLLFEQVREKLSLCYSINVLDNKNLGLVFINTSIDGKNKDIVIDEIKKQINNLITKNYDVNKLEMSRALFINSLESTYDDMDGLINYYYECALTGFNCSIEQYIKGISKVTADDISRVFKQYEYYFAYMLEGKKHE